MTRIITSDRRPGPNIPYDSAHEHKVLRAWCRDHGELAPIHAAIYEYLHLPLMLRCVRETLVLVKNKFGGYIIVAYMPKDVWRIAVFRIDSWLDARGAVNAEPERVYSAYAERYCDVPENVDIGEVAAWELGALPNSNEHAYSDWRKEKGWDAWPS